LNEDDEPNIEKPEETNDEKTDRGWINKIRVITAFMAALAGLLGAAKGLWGR
jgi:hypothetical protein